MTDLHGIYEDKFAPGQTIRSYDFEGRRDCYIEGLIVATHKGEEYAPVSHFAYELLVTKQVLGGKEIVWDDGRPNVFAPMMVMFEYEGRLETVPATPAEIEEMLENWLTNKVVENHICEVMDEFVAEGPLDLSNVEDVTEWEVEVKFTVKVKEK